MAYILQGLVNGEPKWILMDEDGKIVGHHRNWFKMMTFAARFGYNVETVH